MKPLSYLIIICFITSFFSCSIKGLTSSYKKEKDFLNIEFSETISNLDSLNKKTIYAINAETLKEELKKHDKSLVYFWDPFCGSDVCLPLYSVQHYCDTNDIQLFVVVEFYDRYINQFFGQTQHPIFAIDHNYYNSNFCETYSKRFQNELVGFNFRKTDEWYYRYLIFEKDNFLKAENNILEEDTSLFTIK